MESPAFKFAVLPEMKEGKSDVRAQAVLLGVQHLPVEHIMRYLWAGMAGKPFYLTRVPAVEDIMLLAI